MDVDDVIPPEVPAFADARIAAHPTSGADCLLATDEEGRRLAFAFEPEGDAPGVSLVDPDLWHDPAAGNLAEGGPRRFEVVAEAWADDWIPAISAHPVGLEWLARLKAAHPEAYHVWWAQTQYDEGGEEGSG